LKQGLDDLFFVHGLLESLGPGMGRKEEEAEAAFDFYM